ncbi:MAG: clostripain-related cysteine peptidase [Pyrinomonadaceae bacterium]
MQEQEWTIMVYMAGDNNLSVDMAYAMEQIKEFAAGDTDKVNLFVYYDGKSQSIPTLYCDFSDSKNPKQVRSYLVNNKLYPVRPVPDENAADHRSIINFVDWCVNTVPHEKNGEICYGRKAQRYALIISGHSMGFQDIGMFKDESSNHTLSMEKMNWLLERITKTEAELIEDSKDEHRRDDSYERATTEILGQKLDILGFDSCVMGMLEVGYQFSNVAKTMVASEGSVPSAGWTYAKILGNLACHARGLHINEVTANFVSEFVRSQDSYTIGGVAVDMAAWDLSELESLNEEFKNLADKLLECFENKGSTLYRQMERVLLQVHWKCQSYMLEQNVDLGDFCSLLKDECASLMKEIGGESTQILEDIERHCEGVLRELAKAVILSGFSGGKYQYSNGISIFFPWSFAAYDVSRENYETLEFVERTDAGKSWNRFLDKYLSEVTYREALKPTATGDEPAPIILEAVSPIGHSETDKKLRYYSYEYQDNVYEDSMAFFGGESAHAAKMGGREGTKMGGREGTKMGGREGTKMGGREGTKMGGREGTKMGGREGTKMGGREGTKMGGREGTKMGGREGTKMGGREGTKMGGREGTKMGGREGTKMGGREGTIMGGREGTKLGGGGGSSAFFDSFELFKNIETPWNLSGFTKKPKPTHKEIYDDNSLGNTSA